MWIDMCQTVPESQRTYRRLDNFIAFVFVPFYFDVFRRILLTFVFPRRHSSVINRSYLYSAKNRERI